MDYALPAMFIGLFVLQLISSKPKLAIHLSVAIVAIIIAYVSHLFMPDSIAVIIATLLVATIGVLIENGNEIRCIITLLAQELLQSKATYFTSTRI